MIKRISGIYKITNLNNMKFYIGESSNIYERWKNHTNPSILKNSVRLSLIQEEFIKYNLSQRVSTEGVFDNFKFEILEKCADDKNLRLSLEGKYIDSLKPEYNIKGSDNNIIYQNNKDIDKNKGTYWVQYHKVDLDDIRIPGLSDIEELHLYDMNIANHYITSSVPSSNYMIGAYIFLIVGIVIRKKTYYYLYTLTEVDSVEVFDDRFQLSGEQLFGPCLLNNVDGFKDFLKSVGNFGFGLSSLKNNSFKDTLIKLFEQNVLKNYDITMKEFLKSFLDEKTFLSLFDTNNDSQNIKPKKTLNSLYKELMKCNEDIFLEENDENIVKLIEKALDIFSDIINKAPKDVYSYINYATFLQDYIGYIDEEFINDAFSELLDTFIYIENNINIKNNYYFYLEKAKIHYYFDEKEEYKKYFNIVLNSGDYDIIESLKIFLDENDIKL